MAEALTSDQLWLQDAAQLLPEECQPLRRRHRADEIFLFMMGGRILAMMSGFGMLESAYARPYNAANVMMKNLNDLFFGSIAFYLVGSNISLHEIGGITDDIFDTSVWFLHFTYATTSATIISGAVVGRCSFVAYLALSVFVTGVTYPVAMHWAWGHDGFLKEMGFRDFAGSGVVHMFGALCALISVCICGPRVGRFPTYRSWTGIWRVAFMERYPDAFYRGPQNEAEGAVHQSMKSCHNPVQLLFGVFLLMVGFLAFNPASVLFYITDSIDDDLLASRVTVTTLLASAAGSLSSFAVALVRTRSAVIQVPDFVSGLLGSIIASCACCDVVPPLLCFLVGFIGGLLALIVQDMLAWMMIDDPVGAIAAHGMPGAWSVISVALFAKPHCQSTLRGLFYGGGREAWGLLGTQIVGLLVLGLWAVVTTYIAVIVLDLLVGFRCNRSSELLGLDLTDHHTDEGAHQFDPRTAKVIEQAPVRTTLANTLSPPKAYLRKSFTKTVEVDANGVGEEEPHHVPRMGVVHHHYHREDVKSEMAMLKQMVHGLIEQRTAERAAANRTITTLREQLTQLHALASRP